MNDSEPSIPSNVGSEPTPKSDSAPRPKPPRDQTQFAYPKGANSCDLRFSRKGRTLAAAMRAYALPRLLPKLQARTAKWPDCNRHDDLSVEFQDAGVYLTTWLGQGEHCGIAEFPFARLYPVAGGRYNLSVRRLYDWSRAEDAPIHEVFNLFWNLAPNAKYWVKIATHKTFEQCVELLVQEPTF